MKRSFVRNQPVSNSAVGIRNLCCRYPQCLRGFTLVELLAVIAIIGILAGLLLPALSIARRRAKKTTTSMDIRKLATAIQQYETDWGVYPPDDLSAMDSDCDLPTEALVYCLGTTFKSEAGSDVWPDSSKKTATLYNCSKTAGPYMDFPEKQLEDIDGDTGALFYEFVDFFSTDSAQPYIYNVVQAGSSADQNGAPKHNVNSYDLFSVGYDGQTGDATVTYPINSVAKYTELCDDYTDGDAGGSDGSSYNDDDINNWD